MEPQIIKRSGKKVIWRTVGCLLLTAACLWVLLLGVQRVQAGDTQGWITLLAGLLGAVVFGFFTLTWFRLIQRPALVIDDRGVNDSSWLNSLGFIPWEQAVGFLPNEDRSTGARVSSVLIVFADPAWPWSRLRGINRMFNKGNASMGYAPGQIGVDSIAMTGVELAALLVEQRRLRRPDLPVAAGPVPGPQPGTWEVADPNGYLEPRGPQAAPPA
ncbi:STM3941 family protein [Actinomyces bowdenii]|uniref:PH domain-containing protein n=1 Tax=Actinomyces bowdenii TaxID=131109 RepID=A0A853EKB4_9ACTO|nr:STM3941 family protein [Actinomyces bowdenii]MBF0696479.1 hypothetical protein [Actinomyces bowdenii]NYS68652.1 hypothetical protein [Actinomyces bowdenii]